MSDEPTAGHVLSQNEVDAHIKAHRLRMEKRKEKEREEQKRRTAALTQDYMTRTGRVEMRP